MTQDMYNSSKDISLEQEIATKCGVAYRDVVDEIGSIQKEILEYINDHRRKQENYNFSEKNLVRCTCGNKDQSRFLSCAHEGEIVCKECGAVVSSNALYEGDASRSFEGEEDNSQYGAPFNSLMSTSFNLSTRLVSSNGKSTKLQRQQNRIDMNLSKTNCDNKETRIEYKDKRKNKARNTMDGITKTMDLSDAVLDLAHRYFCFYRDNKSKLTDEPKRIAQCLILALRKKREEGESVNRVVYNNATFSCPVCHLVFGTKLDLKLHDCERKETVEKKKMPPLSLRLRPKLRDELDRLREIKN